MSSENHEAFIKMALEAGFESVTVVQNSFADPTKQEIFANGNEVNLTKFAQLVAAHEREQIAKMVEGQKVMTLEPCKPFADERVRAIRESQRHLVKMIRARTQF